MPDNVYTPVRVVLLAEQWFGNMFGYIIAYLLRTDRSLPDLVNILVNMVMAVLM